MIKSLLIANRGEIACRIIHTCHKLGIWTVAVYSEADTNARHVQMADEALCIGPAPATESYLNGEAIIAAAKQVKATAIHPGYGFLAENAAFAEACQAANLIFIGPSPQAIKAMGNKATAKTLMTKANVPVIPGYSGPDQSDETLKSQAEQIGYPIMVKAAAGGGGKGMRLVQQAADLIEALASARREATQAFGSDELLLERAIIDPRHIEIQIFGDQHGHIIHLGERECSIQRRHQKVIEETPSLIVTPKLRAAMGQAAVAAAQAINYTNAGTAEFMLDANQNFYFLEMNTRLQVEHPVTELVTGLDLVEWQIKVAEGNPLPLTQAQVPLNGHAIEVRLYAENPANQFLPVTGPVLHWQAPTNNKGVRVDAGLQSGDHISIYYDPMLAKIIAHGPDRNSALRRLNRALQHTILLGFQHNLSFLQDILTHPDFEDGQFSTAFIEKSFSDWSPQTSNSVALIAVTLAQWINHPQLATNSGYWRNSPNQAARYRYYLPTESKEAFEVHLTPPSHGQKSYQLNISTKADTIYTVELNEYNHPKLTLTINGHKQWVALACHNKTWWIHSKTGIMQIKSLSLLPKPQPPADAGGSLRAAMPGSILDVLVEVGQAVEKGQALLKLEAMKMEHTIRTAAPGTVEAIYFAPGEQVEADALLISIKPTTNG